MREVAVMSLSGDSGGITGNASHMDCGRVAVKPMRTQHVAKLCLRPPTPPIKIERTCFVKHNGTAGQCVPGSSARQVESAIVGVRPLLD
jgi:hypothetical protein